MVYKGMLLPLLEYGDIFLVSASVCNRKRLQFLQNKGLRCALNRDMTLVFVISTERPTCYSYRREQHILKYMQEFTQKPTNRRPTSKLTMKNRSSGKVLLCVKHPYTETFRKSLADKGLKTWNNLPTSFHVIKEKAKYRSVVSDWVVRKASLNARTTGVFESNV